MAAPDPNPSCSRAETVSRAERETLLGQHGLVVWLFGLSGSGKTSLATALERTLHAEGRLTVLLDGDRLRTGLNHGLGFSNMDRTENIRRAAETAKLFVHSGAIVICAFITPTQALRELARQIVTPEDFLEVYTACSFAECERRDVKGLYAQAKAGKIPNFTGRDSVFEPSSTSDLILDTEQMPMEECLRRLHQAVTARTRL